MNKIFSLNLIAITLVGTLLLANEPSKYLQNQNERCDIEFQSFNPKRDMRMPPKENIIGMFHMLDLTSDQKKKLHQIIRNSRKNRPHIGDAFQDKSFDKNKFIEIRIAQKEAKIKSDAEIIEKIYSILTMKQKSQFKTILDMQKIIMQKRMKYKGFMNDKNRNGGR